MHANFGRLKVLINAVHFPTPVQPELLSYLLTCRHCTKLLLQLGIMTSLSLM